MIVIILSTVIKLDFTSSITSFILSLLDIIFQNVCPSTDKLTIRSLFDMYFEKCSVILTKICTIFFLFLLTVHILKYIGMIQIILISFFLS